MFKPITTHLLFLAITAILLISGCGAKGDLFIPKEQQQQSQK